MVNVNSNKELQIISKQSGIIMCRYDMKTRTLTCFCNMDVSCDEEYQQYENAPESLIMQGYVSPESISTFRQYFESMHEGNAHDSVDVLLKLDNSWRWYHCDYHMIYGDNHEPIYAFMTFVDNTEKRNMELASEKWKANLASSISNSIIYAEVNLSKDIVEKIDGEPYFIKNRKTGTCLKEFLECSSIGKLDCQKNVDFFNFFERARLINLYSSDVKEDKMEYCIVNADNSIFWIRTIVHLVKYPSNDDIFAFIIFSNIDEEKKEMAKLSHMAQHDALTGLLNREGIAKRVDAQLKDYNPHYLTAIMIADLDNFKQINDHLGHQFGDEVLQKVSKKLLHCFSDNDMVGRLGGDEFIVLVSREITLEEIESKAMELLQNIQLEHKHEVSISISLGIAYGCSRVSFDKLYKTADIALYTAKKQGKHCFHMINFDTNEGQSFTNQKDNCLIPLQTLLNYVDASKNLNKTMYKELRTPYQALIENMPSGVVVIEFDGEDEKITHCNDWMYHFIGYSKEEMETMHENGILIITHPDDKAKLFDAIMQIRNGLDEMNINFRIQHKDGYYKYVALSVTVTERAPTKTIVYGIYADIHEIMTMQEELHESQTKLNTILDSIPGGMSIIEISEKLSITYVGNWIYQYLGMDNTQLDSLRDGYQFNTVTREDWPELCKAIEKVKNGYEKVKVKYHVFDIDGVAKSITLSGVVVKRTPEKIILNAISMFDS